MWSNNPLEGNQPGPCGSTNPLVGNSPSTEVVGVFLGPAALLRLAGSVLVEIHDDWQVRDGQYLPNTLWSHHNPKTGRLDYFAHQPAERPSTIPKRSS
jgi:hypothetical protein